MLQGAQFMLPPGEAWLRMICGAKGQKGGSTATFTGSCVHASQPPSASFPPVHHQQLQIAAAVRTNSGRCPSAGPGALAGQQQQLLLHLPPSSAAGSMGGNICFTPQQQILQLPPGLFAYSSPSLEILTARPAEQQGPAQGWQHAQQAQHLRVPQPPLCGWEISQPQQRERAQQSSPPLQYLPSAPPPSASGKEQKVGELAGRAGEWVHGWGWLGCANVGVGWGGVGRGGPVLHWT